MPFAFEFNAEDDRRLLMSFFGQLRRFLAELTFVPENFVKENPYVGGMQRYLAIMWDECEAEFQYIEGAVYDEKTTTAMRRAGLSGVSLRAKLAILQEWAERLIRDGVLKILKRVLQHVNTLLGSFVQATGVGELIKEFKETIENIMEE